MDFILLIFLCAKIAKLAKQKNVSKSRWIMTTIFYWIVAEFLAIIVLMNVISIDPEMFQLGKEVHITKEFLYVICTGILGGYLGYLFTRKRMEALPDSDGKIE